MLSPVEIRLQDPLSDVSRKERRNLLAFSTIGILMVKTGLIPSQISALGIDFSPMDQRVLLRIIGLVVAYFLIEFLIYAASDVLSLVYAIREADLDWKVAVERYDVGIGKAPRGGGLWGVGPIFALRVFFEFIFPILLGCYAIYILFFFALVVQS